MLLLATTNDWDNPDTVNRFINSFAAGAAVGAVGGAAGGAFRGSVTQPTNILNPHENPVTGGPMMPEENGAQGELFSNLPDQQVPPPTQDIIPWVGRREETIALERGPVTPLTGYNAGETPTDFNLDQLDMIGGQVPSTPQFAPEAPAPAGVDPAQGDLFGEAGQ